MADTTTTFVWDRDYDNHAQVEPFYDAYLTVRDEVITPSGIAYNDSFVGRIPGIAGPDEGTAIYLLQRLHSLKALDVQIATFIADGGEPLDMSTISKKPTKFSTVVHYAFYMGGTGWTEWADARLVLNHKTLIVLPKGRRTNGFMLHGKVLVRK